MSFFTLICINYYVLAYSKKVWSGPKNSWKRWCKFLIKLKVWQKIQYIYYDVTFSFILSTVPTYVAGVGWEMETDDFAQYVRTGSGEKPN